MLPLYLAPMAELSHRALRELIETFGGCDLYYSEMISAGALTAGGPYEKFYLDNNPVPERFVYQLCGSSIAEITAAAALLEGYDALGIDINMGCSAPAIIRQGAGSAWLGDRAMAAALIRSVRRQTKKRLSVKLRIGINDDFENLVRFCLALEAEGLDFITLHPRTTKEKFKRKARWNYVGSLNAALHIPVAGNGDIDSAEQCAVYAQRADYAAIMLGRLAVRQPWIFAKVTQRSSFVQPDFIESALLFLDLLEQHQPPEFIAGRARRFFLYYCKNFTWGTYLYNQFCHAQSAKDFRSVLQNFRHLMTAG